MASKFEIMDNARSAVSSGDEAKMMESLNEIASLVPQVSSVIGQLQSMPSHERKAALREILEGFLEG
jgi:hypothetical protein